MVFPGYSRSYPNFNNFFRAITVGIYPFQLAPIGWGVYLPGRVWMADVTGKIVEEQYWLVVDLPLWKYDFVSWDDDYSKYMENNQHVPNHQPEYFAIGFWICIAHRCSNSRVIVWQQSMFFSIWFQLLQINWWFLKWIPKTVLKWSSMTWMISRYSHDLRTPQIY